MEILILSCLTVVIILAEAFGAGALMLPLVTFVVLGSAGYAIANFGAPEPEWFTEFFQGMLASDATGQALSAALLTVTGLWLVGFNRSLSQGKGQVEKVALALVSLVGGLVACRFQNLLCLYLGIETLSIPLYILAGTNKHDPRSFEASLKYFFLSAFFSAFRLLGIVLWYGATGSFDLFQGAAELARGASSELPTQALLATSALLILASGLFKLSAVPFHFWAADVYDGAPTPIAAFMMTMSKLAGAGALLRCLGSAGFLGLESVWLGPVSVAVLATLIVGNLAAAAQTSLKRRLAYSSVANAGFLLMGVGTRNLEAVLVFGVGYALATLVVLGALDRIGGTPELSELDGLGRRRPVLAGVMALGLASLAGLPPLPGFFGKYLALAAAFDADQTLWVIVGVVGSVVSAAYYLEIVVRMVFVQPKGEDTPDPVKSAEAEAADATTQSVAA